MSGRAVLVDKTKADGLAHLEVSASLVNNTRVARNKLVTTMIAQPKMSSHRVNSSKSPKTHVETCCSCEILLQKSPFLTVYLREQVAANATEIGIKVG
jgi:hypothetical protein